MNCWDHWILFIIVVKVDFPLCPEYLSGQLLAQNINYQHFDYYSLLIVYFLPQVFPSWQ